MRKQQKQQKNCNTSKFFFDLFSAFLKEKGAWDNVDERSLRTLADMAERIEKYEALVKKHGEVETYPNGAVAPSANYKILVQERKDFAAHCRLFGITPAGREALTGFLQKKQQKSAAINLMKIAK